jgi:hypothetical protein
MFLSHPLVELPSTNLKYAKIQDNTFLDHNSNEETLHIETPGVHSMIILYRYCAKGPKPPEVGHSDIDIPRSKLVSARPSHFNSSCTASTGFFRRPQLEYDVRKSLMANTTGWEGPHIPREAARRLAFCSSTRVGYEITLL